MNRKSEVKVKKAMTGRSIAAASIGAVLLVGGAGSAFAGWTYEAYSTSVPKFGGSGYSGNQKRHDQATFPEIKSATVGGNYTVGAEAQDVATGKGGGWSVRIDDGTYAKVPGFYSFNQTQRIRFWTDWYTPVNVKVTGSWRSN